MLLLLCIMGVSSAERKKANLEDSQSNKTPLDLINGQIVELEAKMKAIEHIKLYAESVHLQELGGRDIEQTVAHLVKSTKMGGQSN